jgi:hypothetical protein
MNKSTPTTDQFGGKWDYGLGFCLQCVAEYKIAGQDPNLFPRYACMTAPLAGGSSSAGTCYEHLNVQPAQQPPPMTPGEAQAVKRLLMPSGQPGSPRHGR